MDCGNGWHKEAEPEQPVCPECGERPDRQLSLANLPLRAMFGVLLTHEETGERISGLIRMYENRHDPQYDGKPMYAIGLRRGGRLVSQNEAHHWLFEGYL